MEDIDRFDELDYHSYGIDPEAPVVRVEKDWCRDARAWGPNGTTPERHRFTKRLIRRWNRRRFRCRTSKMPDIW